MEEIATKYGWLPLRRDLADMKPPLRALPPRVRTPSNFGLQPSNKLSTRGKPLAKIWPRWV